jgi:hypothetical protein
VRVGERERERERERVRVRVERGGLPIRQAVAPKRPLDGAYALHRGGQA